MVDSYSLICGRGFTSELEIAKMFVKRIILKVVLARKRNANSFAVFEKAFAGFVPESEFFSCPILGQSFGVRDTQKDEVGMPHISGLLLNNPMLPRDVL